MTAIAGDAPEILLRHHLKKLKLPTVLREHEKIARQCAAENVDHVRYLARLIELELLDREARMIDRRIKSAKFPAIKSLESFDFDAIPALNKKTGSGPGAWRVCQPPREHHRSWPVWRRQNAHRSRHRTGGMPARDEDALRHRRWHCSRTD